MIQQDTERAGSVFCQGAVDRGFYFPSNEPDIGAALLPELIRFPLSGYSGLVFGCIDVVFEQAGVRDPQ